MNTPLLNINNLCVRYSRRIILDALSLSLVGGEWLAVIGPNGCGKSTLLRAIVGEYVRREGVIEFQGKDISQSDTFNIVQQGIGYLRQTNNIFSSLTVKENLDIACMGIPHVDLIAQRREKILNIFPALQEYRSTRAGLLSGGQSKQLAVSMVLIRPVSLLLLDEPIAGLSPQKATEILKGIASLQEFENFSVILVEHRRRLIQPYVERLVIMVEGKIAADVKGSQLLTDRQKLEKVYSI